MCRDCQSASTTWHWGGITSDCRGCFIRSMARSPQHIRSRIYDQELSNNGGPAKDALVDAVRKEYARIQQLKRDSQREAV